MRSLVSVGRAAALGAAAVLALVGACVDLGALEGGPDGGGVPPEGGVEAGRDVVRPDGPRDAGSEAPADDALPETAADAPASDAGTCGTAGVPDAGVLRVVARDLAAPAPMGITTAVVAKVPYVFWVDGKSTHYTHATSVAMSSAIGTCVLDAWTPMAAGRDLETIHTDGNRLIVFGSGPPVGSGGFAGCCTFVVTLGGTVKCGVETLGVCLGDDVRSSELFVGVSPTTGDAASAKDRLFSESPTSANVLLDKQTPLQTMSLAGPMVGAGGTGTVIVAGRDGSISAVPSSGAPKTLVGASARAVLAMGFEATGSLLYWLSDDGTVSQMNVGGIPAVPKVIMTVPSVHGPVRGASMYVNAAAVYIATGSDAVFGYKLGPGTVHTIATGEATPTGVTELDGMVFWANQGDGTIKAAATP